ncbi:pyridoxal-dependent decarboxylase, exosortase A system-associated [Glacieibacterium frigidum]|uniref:Pyridoxal-dependent decarboxylase, exosortase A system-associated n=1 Tax=Glacieibacterium frigidum TaxID=2593303 RepID=A0A552UHK3_9SPHN|nr:pyridoxal-dependent decarboxylase, exosortase A system-associated [Glacieibacterium frigidum]TRW17667.1 pyridoxal-dependent decarboxylase, exosortase A system-associated [Glacieibacterium frigidum]
MSHVPPDFEPVDRELGIAGQPASHWASEGTPVFVYDRAIIAARIAAVREAFPGVELHYAIKANPLPALVEWMGGQVDGLDVASAGELALAARTGLPIGFAGPGKRDAELAEAIAAGATVSIESGGELERFAGLGGRTALLRVNPDFELKGSGMKMGGRGTPFGIDADQVPGVAARAAALGVRIKGFHVYAGSQTLSAAALIEAQAATVALAVRLAGECGIALETLNLGGGFGIPYFANDTALDVAAVGAALPALPGTRLILELGRYLVGESGVYLTRVVDVKTSRGTAFVVADGGMHHQLAASGNLGTVIRRNYPIANASRFAEAATATYDVTGCLCTPLDRLGERVALPDTRVGDLIAVFMAGAYGASASPTAFLGHPPAREVLA